MWSWKDRDYRSVRMHGLCSGDLQAISLPLHIMRCWKLFCSGEGNYMHALQRWLLLGVKRRLVFRSVSNLSSRQVLGSVCGECMLNLRDWQVLDRHRVHLRHLFIL